MLNETTGTAHYWKFELTDSTGGVPGCFACAFVRISSAEMLKIQRLRIAYALAGILFAGYYSFKLLARHAADHSPITSGTVNCLILFVSVPVFGYILLFKLFPLAGRFLRR